MMDARKFLIPPVHQIAVSAELAIDTGTAEKPNAHALTKHPASHTRTEGIDPPDDFMHWDAANDRDYLRRGL